MQELAFMTAGSATGPLASRSACAHGVYDESAVSLLAGRHGIGYDNYSEDFR
jgi:hypothetical protein